MRERATRWLLFAAIGAVCLWAGCSTAEKPKPAVAPAESAKATIHWNNVEEVSNATPTLQVVVNPPLRRGSKIHDRVFQNLKELGADYVRYVPWLPYPKLAVAELEPPANGKTSWDFSLIDPMMEDFMNATAGHSVVINFSTIPQWMWKTPKPVAYPSDPDQVDWNYEQGTELRDPSMKEVADYYARLVSWYTKGGFTDIYGKRHESGHHYKIQYWEVLNEVNGEHHMTAEFYTRLYDAIVTAIHKVDPTIKFMGMGYGGTNPRFFQYFLNHQHHKPGIPMNMISYHFYAVPTREQTIDNQQYTFFDQADHFLDVVRYIQVMRERLSPKTGTDVDEIGSISPTDFDQGKPGYKPQPIPNAYWNLSGALYAYIYVGLAKEGIEVAGESQLVGYPTQYPSVSLVDWKTGQPNARFWVLKLLHDNFGPGDKMVNSDSSGSYLLAQGFVTPKGERKILLINKRNRSFKVSLPGVDSARVTYVSQETGFNPPASAQMSGGTITLSGFEVAVVDIPQ